MNKKIFLTIVVILILGIIGVGIYLFLQNTSENNETEIQPQEEITEEQMRQTIVTLYYLNKETKELMPEGRMVDAKTLLTDPYTTLLELLMEAPKNEKLQSVIPEGTRILKTELKGDMVYVDLSKEFIDNHTGGLEAETTTIYSIVNTLTELNEVNSVKILINGKENQSFKDEKVSFKDAFVRIESQEGEEEENTIQK
jgi:germination protein M